MVTIIMFSHIAPITRWLNNNIINLLPHCPPVRNRNLIKTRLPLVNYHSTRYVRIQRGDGDKGSTRGTNHNVCPNCKTLVVIADNKEVFVKCPWCRMIFDNPCAGKSYDRSTKEETSRNTLPDLLSPTQLTEYLDCHVIGQERAKKVISVAVYNHYKRLWIINKQKIKKSEKEEEKGRTIGDRKAPAGKLTPQQSDSKPFTTKHLPDRVTESIEMHGSSWVANNIKGINEGKEEGGREDNNGLEEVEIDKSNIMLFGPTGCGKTLIAQRLGRILDVPVVVCDCTSLTQAGYVGEDIDSVIHSLLQAADYNVELAERGIIFLDEIDKLSKPIGNSIVRDVSGEGVQQGLLKILEGTLVSLQIKKPNTQQANATPIQIDTSNILFIASGAFVGLDRIVNERAIPMSIGFGATVGPPVDCNKVDRKAMLKTVPDDLVRYGLIPEFVGRFPVLVGMEGLDKQTLLRILTEPENCIMEQYYRLFQAYGVRLLVTYTSLNEISQKCLDYNTGARALRSILEELFLDAMFWVPGSRVKMVLLDVDDKGSLMPPILLAEEEIEQLDSSQMEKVLGNHNESKMHQSQADIGDKIYKKAPSIIP